jgi:hypothetical protein
MDFAGIVPENQAAIASSVQGIKNNEPWKCNGPDMEDAPSMNISGDN